MEIIAALLLVLLYLLLLLAPIAVPIVVAVSRKDWPVAARVGIAFAGLVTLHYTLDKYQEALDHDSDFRGFRVLAIPPFEIFYASYCVILLGSFGLLLNQLWAKQLNAPITLASVLAFAGCLLLAGTWGPAFMALPFKDDTLSRRIETHEPRLEQFQLLSQASSNTPSLNLSKPPLP
jgi:hypothetical protein